MPPSKSRRLAAPKCMHSSSRSGVVDSSDIVRGVSRGDRHAGVRRVGARRAFARSRSRGPAPWPGRVPRWLYFVILMIRSIPSRVWSRPSWVSMKHACTYQPGLAVIVSCWKASWERGPSNAEGLPGDELLEPLFLTGQQSLDDLLGGVLALDGKAISMCTRKPSFSKRTSSPSCSVLGPRKPNSIERIVACGVGSGAGDRRGDREGRAHPPLPSPSGIRARYWPGCRSVWASLVCPGSASASNTIEPNFARCSGPLTFASLRNVSASSKRDAGLQQEQDGGCFFAGGGRDDVDSARLWSADGDGRRGRG